MKRKPAVAGLFYPSRRDELIEQIRMCFLDKRIGPGELPVPVETKLQNPIGLVSPHAGYIYSGPVAAWGFLEANLLSWLLSDQITRVWEDPWVCGQRGSGKPRLELFR